MFSSMALFGAKASRELARRVKVASRNGGTAAEVNFRPLG